MEGKTEVQGADLTVSGPHSESGQAGMGTQAMMGNWENEWNPCFIIYTLSPSPKTTPGNGRMMLKCFSMPTAALGRGDRAQLPLPSSCGLPGCFGNHSLTAPLLLEAECSGLQRLPQ